MKIADRVSRAAGNTQAVWALATLVAIIATLATCPFYYVIATIAVCWVGYYLTLVCVGLYIGHVILRDGIDPEELRESRREIARRQISGESLDDEAAEEAAKMSNMTLSKISRISDKAACRFGGQEIPEWIEIDYEDGTTSRFEFDSIAIKDNDGIPIVPDEPGIAHVNGVLFRKLGQPAQGE